jgi:hypothetical protein
MDEIHILINSIASKHHNIKMDLREIGWDGYGSGKGPVEGSCEHGIQPSGSI